LQIFQAEFSLGDMTTSGPVYALKMTWRFLVFTYSWAVLLVIALATAKSWMPPDEGAVPFSLRLDLLDLSFFSRVSLLQQSAGRFGVFAAAHRGSGGLLGWAYSLC
jgi:hypothetical protein